MTTSGAWQRTGETTAQAGNCSQNTDTITAISIFMPSDPNDSSRKNSNSAYIEMHPTGKMEEFRQLLKFFNYHK